MNEDVVALVDDYVDQHAQFAFQEFNVLRVAHDQFADGVGEAAGDGSLTSVKLRYRDLIRDEITAFKRDMQREFRIAFERAVGARDDWRADALASDPVHPHVDEPRREAFAEDLLDYLEDVGDAMAPLLREEGDAWDVVRAVCDRDEAEERLASIAHHADVYGPYADDITIAVDFRGLDVFDDVVDYSDEAIRVIRHGEDYIRRVIAADVRRAYDGD